MQFDSNQHAFGSPGIEPRWTRSDKDAVGTAYSASSRIWFTLAAGIVSEVYYPTIDRPQVRDLQFLITDGETFFHDERRHLDSQIEQIEGGVLGYRMTNICRDRPYRIVKEIIADPHYACLLVRTRLEGDKALLSRLRLYALLAPHLEGGGRGNNGSLTEVAGYKIIMAQKGRTWLAFGASVPLLARSCGYVGASDGWTDLADNYQMDWEFESATDGNIALVAQLDLSRAQEFTLAVSFGNTAHDAKTTLVQSLGVSFVKHRDRFVEQWHRVCAKVRPLEHVTFDKGALYRRSHSLLLAHEDKHFAGAMIASLSIPWGESKGDEDLGGYHLVWPRDLVQTSTALLASGNSDASYRSLVYLACSQTPAGGFHQNFWIDGDPYWTGVQLDEVSFAILLAHRAKVAGALHEFDPYPMVLRAASYLVHEGPATAQERWEENSGYSPSTLATNIAALTCAALFAQERGDLATAQFLHEYADFLESHVERWTVTTQGTLVPGIPRHYIRILPADLSNPDPIEDPDLAVVEIKNQPPNRRYVFPAKEVIDAGFLQLVRYGIRKAGDPLIEDSLAVVDETLRVDTPYGPCWRRYNHDGYGQQDDGRPFDGYGRGRAWPLLTGERGHYELASGRDPAPYLRAMERFGAHGLLPEQVWDSANQPESRLWLGKPTGSAMPLVWAHAEYISLVRSAADGVPFDLIPEVAERYGSRRECQNLEIWKANRHPRSMTPGATLRVQEKAPFVLHWTDNEWRDTHDTTATGTALGIYFVDIPTKPQQQSPLRFTLLWTEENRWAGHDYAVPMEAARGA